MNLLNISVKLTQFSIVRDAHATGLSFSDLWNEGTCVKQQDGEIITWC